MEKSVSNADKKRARKQNDGGESTLIKILQGKTCFPLSLQEFRKFLETKEFSEENLAIVEWFISYRSRFTALPLDERKRSPPVAPASQLQPAAAGISFATASTTTTNGPSTVTPSGRPTSPTDSEFGESLLDRFLEGIPPNAAITLDQKLSGESIKSDQPLRSEVNAAIKIFFTADGEKELNIPGQMRRMIVENAQTTTHPSVFAPAVKHCFDIMRSSSLPSFMKHATQNIQNGSRWDRGFKGIVCLGLGFILCFLLIYFGQSRWTRISAFPFFVVAAGHFYTVQTKVCLWNLDGRKKEVILVEQDVESGTKKKPTVLVKTVEEPLVLDRQARIKLQLLATGNLIGIILTIIVVVLPEQY